MIATDLDQVIEVLEPVVRRAIREEFPSPQSCIESCHILAALLEDFGLRPRAFPVKTLVLNRAYLERAEREGPPPDRATFARWHQESGAYTVHIGAGLWPGHLVLLTEEPEEAALWDCSIDQADMPEAGLVLPPLLTIAPIDLNALKNGQAIECRLSDGVGLRYTAQPQAEPLPVSMWPLANVEMIQAAARVTAHIREKLNKEG